MRIFPYSEWEPFEKQAYIHPFIRIDVYTRHAHFPGVYTDFYSFHILEFQVRLFVCRHDSNS